MKLELWTDGSGTASGPIGWAYVLRAVNDAGLVLQEHTAGGFASSGTNNRAELMGVLDGLRALKRPAIATVFTDSEYVSKAFTEGYLERWLHNGFRKSDGGEAANADLWERIAEAAAPHRLTFEHVPGHTGIELNERCDRLAGAARKVVKNELEAA